MKDSITLEWQASDGYAGGSRPQHTTLSESELLDCDTVEEAMTAVEEAIQEDFNQKVSASYDEDKIKKAVQKLFDEKKKAYDKG